MSDERVTVVPYIVYEGEQARNERLVKRLIVLLAITILLFFVSNILWLRAWTSYDYAVEDSSELISIDGGTRGIANYVGNDGSITNGEDYSQENDTESNTYAEIGE